MASATRIESGSDAQERILSAALRAFSENGFDGATLREIATRANVNLGLVQYYYRDKLRLWKAAVDLAFAELRGGFEALLADPEPADAAERLRRVIRAHTLFVAQNPEFVRLMHDEGKRRGPRMRWLVDRHTKPLFEKLIPLIESAQDSGVLPGDISPFHLIYVFVGAVGIIFHQAEECRRVAGFDPSDPEAAEAHARAVEYLFLGPSRQEIPR